MISTWPPCNAMLKDLKCWGRRGGNNRIHIPLIDSRNQITLQLNKPPTYLSRGREPGERTFGVEDIGTLLDVGAGIGGEV